jgi:CDP-diacylglycerol--serine O-phosphatidyltransferase
MKHLPNILTLANLIFGCIAITYALTVHPTIINTGEEAWFLIEGMEQLYMASFFIGLAALMDLLDGFAARLLNAFSPIGKDLDSLADVVSFGAAPSMILFQLIWRAYMQEPGALDTPMIAMAPAFLVACFAALRLARFNQTASSQKAWFLGMPVPATGLLIASLPLVIFYGPAQIASIVSNRWVLYAIIALVCWLMVSNIKFLKWSAPGKGIGAWWPQLLVAAVLLGGAFVIQFAAIPLAFLVYIICSLVYKYPEKAANTSH